MPVKKKGQSTMKRSAPTATVRKQAKSTRCFQPARRTVRATSLEQRGAITSASGEPMFQKTELVDINDRNVSPLAKLSENQLIWWLRTLGIAMGAGRSKDPQAHKNRMIWAIQGVPITKFMSLDKTALSKMAKQLGVTIMSTRVSSYYIAILGRI